MQPDLSKITIKDNINLIRQLFSDLVLYPRQAALKWSAITKQSPNIKIGYPAQHLASLVVGMEGSRSGARGKDIIDGSEVKGCSKIDQLDTCNDCKEKVSRMEDKCAACGSANIRRMDDSKWLFTLRSEKDLRVFLEETDRIILVVSDYKNFHARDFNTLRFRVFEIWPKSPRQSNFAFYMREYYEKIYLEHRRASPDKVPAPKNLFPDSFPFYMCNPINVFYCEIINAHSKPEIEIINYVEPEKDRSGIESELMPSSILNPREFIAFIIELPPPIADKLLIGFSTRDYAAAIEERDYLTIRKMIPFISEEARTFIPVRGISSIRTAKTQYKRGRRA